MRWNFGYWGNLLKNVLHHIHCQLNYLIVAQKGCFFNALLFISCVLFLLLLSYEALMHLFTATKIPLEQHDGWQWQGLEDVNTISVYFEQKPLHFWYISYVSFIPWAVCRKKGQNHVRQCACLYNNEAGNDTSHGKKRNRNKNHIFTIKHCAQGLLLIHPTFPFFASFFSCFISSSSLSYFVPRAISYDDAQNA